ncbi:Abi family protein [Aerococcaceae bacterium NML190073]|nr:Abi family protein [Aerococcaceae bacterium NML190073]
METQKVKTVKISDVNEPYQTIDVSDYDSLYIDGYRFPCEANGRDCDVSLKAPQRFGGMIDCLGKKVSFNSDEERMAVNLLKRINYYKLSVFTKLLEEDERSFTRLLELYEFDVFLKQELVPILKEIENLFKANLTYYLVNNYEQLSKEQKDGTVIIQNDPAGGHHSSEFYLDYGIYGADKMKVDKMLSQFAENVTKKRTKELYINHHIKNYGGHIPFWVLVETLTFGEIIRFYSYLSKEIRKKWRDGFFEVEVIKENEIEWLKTLQFLRNDCAHDNRLYGRTFNFTPELHFDDMKLIFGEEEANLSLMRKRSVPIEKHEKYDEIKTTIEKSKKTLFTGLVIIRYFMEAFPGGKNKNWNEFLERLDETIKSKKIPNRRIGFRNNWKEVLKIK